MWEVSLTRCLILALSWPLWRLEARIRYALTGSCGMECGWTTPYGFVPEAGCPIHDE